jgi:membrane-associated phospholipid phosphatase
LKSSFFIGLASLLLFLAVDSAVFLGYGSRIDTNLFITINHLELPQILNSLNVYASLYGREYFWLGFVLIIFALGDNTSREKILYLISLFLIGIFVGDFIKIIEFRPRPFVSLQNTIVRIQPDYDSSFPSGHALIVSIGATYALISFRKSLAALLSLEAGTVCFSRIYVGVHFPSDVFGAILLGVSITSFGTMFLDKYLRSQFTKISRYASMILGSGYFRV